MDEQLLQAAEEGDTDKLQELLHSKPYDKDSDSFTLNSALTKAAEKNRSDCVRILVQAGVDINYCGVYRYTPIHWACINDDVDLVDFLIKTGSDIPNDCRTACMHLTRNVKIMDLLVKAGADVNVIEYDDCVTPLISSAAGGHDEAVKFLLSAGADANKGSVPGTALELAAYNNNSECVKLLLPKVNTYDKENSYLIASQHGCIESIKEFLKAGLSVDAKIKTYLPAKSKYNRVTALMKAASGNQVECIKFLLEKGAPLKDEDDFGNSIFMYACGECKFEAMQLLIKKGFNVNSANKQGETPLIKAIDRPYKRWVPGATIETPQHPCKIKCVKMLIEFGADVNKKSAAGDTALNVSGKQNQLEYIKLLLTNNCKINTFNKAGRNAYVWHVQESKKKSEKLKLMLLAAGESRQKFKFKRHFILSKAAPQKGIFKQCLPLFCANHIGDPTVNVVYDIDWSCWVEEPASDENDSTGNFPGLKDSCRTIIRRHLLQLDPFTNLFQRVKLLGLPASLTSYLVFDVDLTLSEPEEDSDDSGVSSDDTSEDVAENENNVNETEDDAENENNVNETEDDAENENNVNETEDDAENENNVNETNVKNDGKIENDTQPCDEDISANVENETDEAK